MKLKPRTWTALGAVTVALALAASPADAQGCEAFRIRRLATGLNQPKGIDCPAENGREGLMRNHLYVAESGAERILEFATNGQRLAEFPVQARFPVGVACYGSAYAQDLYVGGAYTGGVRRLDVLGDDHAFALENLQVAGMDFGYGALFVGEWPTGNIWRIDPLGNAELFATIPGQARYLKFSPPTDVPARLYVTEFGSGAIYRIDPDGLVTLFAQTDATCLEGLAFSRGGPFGYYLYAGDLCTGDIYRVNSAGNVGVWRDMLPGAADICFTRSGLDQWVMYVVDGQVDGSLWAITAVVTDLQ